MTPEEVVDETIRRATEAGNECGSYLESASAADMGLPGLHLVLRFCVGDVAFTDAVLNPAAEADRVATRRMEANMTLAGDDIARRARATIDRLRRKDP